MNILLKLFLLIKNYKVVVVLKQENSEIIDLISSIFESHVKIQKINSSLNKLKILDFFKNKIVVVEMNLQNKKEIKDVGFLIKKSIYPVFVLERNLSENDLTKNSFEKINFLLKTIGKKGKVIIDSKNSRKINLEEVSVLKVGLSEDSDIRISDLNVSENTNFKINHLGDVVPFWFNDSLDQNEIKNILLVIAVGMSFNFNLIEISQKLKKLKSNDF